MASRAKPSPSRAPSSNSALYRCSRPGGNLGLEGLNRILGIAPRERDHPQQPLQSAGRESTPRPVVALLGAQSLFEGCHCRLRCATRDKHHRPLKMRERKVWVQREGARKRVEAFGAPGRVSQPELVQPLIRFNRHGAECGVPCALAVAGAGQHERQGGMRLGIAVVEGHPAARVLDRLRQHVGWRVGPMARAFVEVAACAGQADVRGRIARVELNCRREALNGLGHGLGVQRLEQQPALDGRAIRVEVGRVAGAPRRSRRGGTARHVYQLLCDRVLQLEDAAVSAIGLRLGPHVARGDIDEPRGNAQPVVGVLKSAGHEQVSAQGARCVNRRPVVRWRRKDARPVDRPGRAGGHSGNP